MVTPITYDKSTQTQSFDELIQEKINEKLKDLKLPDEAYDPVTHEELTDPCVAFCGHSMNWDTFIEVYNKEKTADDSIKCPVCRKKIYSEGVFEEITFKNMIQSIKNIIKKDL